MTAPRAALAIVLLILIGAFFAFDLGRYFDLAEFKARQAGLMAWRDAHPVATAGAYFSLYVAMAALSLPGATVLTLIGGAIFGLFWGTLIISFASTVGATLAFLSARFLLRDWAQDRYRDRLAAINRGVERDGALYLLTLRLVPLFPFFVINLLMGLTPIATRTFYLVSQIGMLPATLVYVNAGTQIARLESARGLLAPELIGAFVLLAVFPFGARRVIDAVKARRALRAWPRPKRFDRNLVVIGGGSAGLVTAYIAAAVRAKVTLIEERQMGGECLNTGCVPSKTLIRSARLLADTRRAREFGFKSAHAEFEFADIMARVRRVIAAIAPHDSAERYTALGVECLHGRARVTSPYTIDIDGRTLTTRAIVVATGSRPLVPPLPGLDAVGYLTSDTVWNLTALPDRLLVLGGGPIGCELAQCFARFGSRVTLVELAPRLLPREDEEFSALLAARLVAEGVDVRTGHAAQEFRRDAGRKLLICEHAGATVEIGFDECLAALGRKGHATGLGLEALGVGIRANGTIDVDEYLRTRTPTIYACGDVAGPYQFTHTAAHQAWYCAVNALFGAVKKFRADYSVIPWCTFTDPEIARVGLNEQEARERGVPHEVTTFDLGELDRALTDEEALGRVKVLTVPGKDKILGVTIAAAHAGDTIAEFVLALRHGLGLNKLLRTIHIYPTYAEANKYAAGAWRRAHSSERLLQWVARYHAWRRG